MFFTDFSSPNLLLFLSLRPHLTFSIPTGREKTEPYDSVSPILECPFYFTVSSTTSPAPELITWPVSLDGISSI